MLDILIQGGSIVDGTGKSKYLGDLGIKNDRIVTIGKLNQLEATTVINASGKIVSPGFIDIHQHSDFTPLINRRCESAVRQGITTAVIGNCGHGCAPISSPQLAPMTLLGYRPEWGVEISWLSFGEYLDRFRSPGVSINFYPLIPHGTVRAAVMGFDRRRASYDELKQMRFMVDQAMEEGGAGLSTGLEYFPGSSADKNELIELAKVVGRHSGVYSSHIRNRGDAFVDAVEEALEIGKAGGLSIQLSHLAPRPYAPTDIFEKVLEKVYATRDQGVEVVIDTFPDTYGPGPVAALLPEEIIDEAPLSLPNRLKNEVVRKMIQASFAHPTNYLFKGAGSRQIFLTYVPERAQLMGKSLGEAASISQQEPYELVCEILISAGESYYNVFLEHLYAKEQDLQRLMSEPICALGSDGIITAPYGELKDFTFNSSSYGYTARVLGEYVLQKRFYEIEDAIWRMTGLPATVLGLADRGSLRIGQFADVVVFDPLTIKDNTSREHPNEYPDGIDLVIINGVITIQNGKHTGKLNGRLLN